MTYSAPEINPYDPNTPDPQPETLPLDEIIRRAVVSSIQGLKVMLPAVITAVHGNQKVDIQLLLKTRYMSGEVVSLPPIQNVMVSMPMGQNYSIKLPIAVGDKGYAIFADRSLDIWSVSDGGLVDPQDTRAHDISDPIFVPGLVPFSQQTQDSTDDLIITAGEAKAKFQQAGKFVFTNGTNELVDLMDQLLDTLITQTYTLTMMGPQPFIASTNALLQQIKTKLETLKGS